MIAFQRRYSEPSMPYYLKENVNIFTKISLQNDFFCITIVSYDAFLREPCLRTHQNYFKRWLLCLKDFSSLFYLPFLV